MGKDKLEELWDKYMDYVLRELAKLTVEIVKDAIKPRQEESPFKMVSGFPRAQIPPHVIEYFEKGWRDYFWSEDDFEAKSDNWGE